MKKERKNSFFFFQSTKYILCYEKKRFLLYIFIKMLSLNDYIKEQLEYNNINEVRSINFGPKDKFGQCIILAGSGGSGKGFIRQNKVLTDYKIFNVDSHKKLYIAMQKLGLIADNREYNLDNKDDMNDLHIKLKEKDWKHRERNQFTADKSVNTDKLPNICFDMVCSKEEDLKEVLDMVKPLGYKVTLVWVICNLQVALASNQKRARHVDDKILKDAYNAVTKFIPDLLSEKYPKLSGQISKAYIALSAGNERDLDTKYNKNDIIYLEKDGEGDTNFHYERYKEQVDKFLNEIQPEISDEEKQRRKNSKERAKVHKERFGSKW